MTYKDYEHKYGSFSDLLVIAFLDEDDSDDFERIKYYINYAIDVDHNDEKSRRYFANVLRQGREVLELEPFPEGWIWDTAGRGPKLLFDTTKAWVSWVLDKFEEEVRRIGKM